MIISMTGFGSAEQLTENYSLKVEVKSLNSKYFDVSLKLPKEFAQWEIEIKAELEKGLKRGKVGLVIDFQTKIFEELPVEFNEELFSQYFQKLRSMAQAVGGKTDDLFKIAVAMPNVIVSNDLPDQFIKFESLKAVIIKAIANCNKYRKTEGEKLKVAILASKDKIEEGLEVVKLQDPKRIESIKSRIMQSLQELKERVQLDQNRFEQELIYYIEKLDLTEEKVRLASHLNYLDEVINQDEPSGKKLGFLTQEIGREINTIGSKANQADIQRVVIGMKEELEKIKEQILNVL